MIRIGTSGFSYQDWVGPVYPAALKEQDYLPFYAREFSAVELNVTYYRVPSPRVVEGWVRRTPDGFLFSAKAHQSITHEREAPDFGAFAHALEPLVSSGRMGCVLAQFPNGFANTAENRDYLRRLREGFRELPVVVEFRNADWAAEPTLALLRELEFGYCCVDEPPLRGLMPPLAVATGPVAYVRFHGRNTATWYSHKEAWERYDYTYRQDELRAWAPKIRALDAAAELTLVYFNNHFRGQAVTGARDLGQILLDLE
jgi:uncharacterized protein YecE (DUF72 family)